MATTLVIVGCSLLLSGLFLFAGYIGYRLGAGTIACAPQSDEEATAGDEGTPTSPCRVIARSERQEARLEQVMSDRVDEELEGLTFR